MILQDVVRKPGEIWHDDGRFYCASFTEPGVTYRLQGYQDDDRLTILCDCPAGRDELLCRHGLSMLLGHTSAEKCEHVFVNGIEIKGRPQGEAWVRSYQP